MGRQSRRKREKPPSERKVRSFDAAIREVMLEDAKKEPCHICGGPPSKIHTWTPDHKFLRRLGATEDTATVKFFSLCSRCNALPNSLELVSKSYYAKEIYKIRALEAGMEIDGNFFNRPGEIAPEWVKSIVEKDSHSAGCFFIWAEDPERSIYIRTHDGEYYGLTEEGERFLPQPEHMPQLDEIFRDLQP